MNLESDWVSEKKASQFLSVEESKLDILREKGYFKPGVHWKSSPDPGKSPWNPKVFYCVTCCNEVLGKLENIDDHRYQIAE